MGKKSKLAPGFRFHPTDVELVMYYLKRKVLGKKLSFNAIGELDIYKHPPWDLPHLSSSSSTTGELKWYFYCPMEKKYGKGARLNRATQDGYWKTTGKDRVVEYKKDVVGMKKTLVFHQGKPPRGIRTDWVLHEYRLDEKKLAERGIIQDSYTLCVVFKKDGLGPRNGSEYGAPFNEDDWSDDDDNEEEEKADLTGIGCMPTVGVGESSGLCSVDVHEFITDHIAPEVAAEYEDWNNSTLSMLMDLTGNDSYDKGPVAAAESFVVQTPQVYEQHDDIYYMLESFTEVDNFFASI